MTKGSRQQHAHGPVPQQAQGGLHGQAVQPPSEPGVRR